MTFKEKHSRSLTKALTYRTLILVSDSIIVYLFTRNTSATIGFVLISNVISTALYFFHERFWNSVHWGKQHIQKHISGKQNR